MFCFRHCNVHKFCTLWPNCVNYKQELFEQHGNIYFTLHVGCSTTFFVQYQYWHVLVASYMNSFLACCRAYLPKHARIPIAAIPSPKTVAKKSPKSQPCAASTFVTVSKVNKNTHSLKFIVDFEANSFCMQISCYCVVFFYLSVASLSRHFVRWFVNVNIGWLSVFLNDATTPKITLSF